MSYECAECERDLRGGHDPNCSRYVPPTRTRADDLAELGGLSSDERDQLAADLQREQARLLEISGGVMPALQLERKLGLVALESGCEREHVTDGSTCWCKPTIEDYRRDSDADLLRPLNDQVFLVRVKPADTTASGLAIPESAQSKGCECRVLAAGPGAKNARTGERTPMSVAAGDRVVIGKWQGNEVTIPDYVRAAWGIDDREPVIVVRETEILAVIAG